MIFITYGEHDLTDNIIHFVLARLPDAPPGTRGISLFLAPKFLLNTDGTLGALPGRVFKRAGTNLRSGVDSTDWHELEKQWTRTPSDFTYETYR